MMFLFLIGTTDCDFSFADTCSSAICDVSLADTCSSAICDVSLADTCSSITSIDPHY